MSYRQSFHKQIAVHYSGRVSYSGSVDGKPYSGTVTYSGTAYEDVHVNIDVETTPFDDSIVNAINPLMFLQAQLLPLKRRKLSLSTATQNKSAVPL